MPWTEKDTQSSNGSQSASTERTQVLDETKEKFLPIAQKEAQGGAKPVQPIDFQPVQSPGNYEAEFAVKGDDVIFHFWPWGYHDAERRGSALPRFGKSFIEYLNTAMSKTFGQHRLQISEDADMGAFFVKAVGFGSNQFHRKLCIEACENLHQRFES